MTRTQQIEAGLEELGQLIVNLKEAHSAGVPPRMEDITQLAMAHHQLRESWRRAQKEYISVVERATREIQKVFKDAY